MDTKYRMMTVKLFSQYLILPVILGMAMCVNARGTYQEPSEFIQEVFSGDAPKVSKIWIKKDLKMKIYEIMEHDLGVLRLKYWEKAGRTAWILEEIGKERPITAGIVVNDSKIESINVLVFRESRGWEVRYPFFTDQFSDATLKEDKQLDRHIDGISGATITARGVTNLVHFWLGEQGYGPLLAKLQDNDQPTN